ncbi:PadR family transcriptional regulator [Solwaraspora sp. WMMD791]|uniref:PadR family transcriptional regulator n=1 Tax=Solwaraspora sp. WMMD791 TaxID=3016086 RepID=UPI00249BCE08|nr:PadR family transcriptional regulator [Solwaraspora sp. WMMD791]WFE29152.1 PadR family transcriptional regulator [Solwaraspora sp. WMMD791]
MRHHHHDTAGGSPGWRRAGGRRGFGPFGPGFGFGPGGPGFGPGGPGSGPGGWGRGGRGGRGRRRPNVRAAVLALLVEGPMHGYEMIQELDSRTGGVWRPSPGSIYPTLQLLEDEGLIVGTAEGSGGGRKRYALTDAARPEAEQAAQAAPWTELAPETVDSWHDVRESGMQTMHALRHVMLNGTAEQRERAVQVLDETRRKLYAILADSE